MFRSVLIISAAAAGLAACTGDTPIFSSSTNPPGFVDRNRDGIDDRRQGPYANPNNPPGFVDRNGDGVDDRLQNPNNPPGFVDRNRDGRDDRVQPRGATTGYSGGYYDAYGVWRPY